MRKRHSKSKRKSTEKWCLYGRGAGATNQKKKGSGSQPLQHKKNKRTHHEKNAQQKRQEQK
jgi:hypothetical protein